MLKLYTSHNFTGLAGLLIKTWGLDEARRRAKRLIGKNTKGDFLLTLLDDAEEARG